MYVVERVARGHRYLYLVESVREGKTVRQRTIKALGRKDVLAASGELDRLAASIARHAQRSVILSDIDAGRIAARRSCHHPRSAAPNPPDRGRPTAWPHRSTDRHGGYAGP